MHIFGKKHPGRQVRHGEDEKDSGSGFQSTANLGQTNEYELTKKKRWPKRVALAVVVLILVLLLLVVLGFYYIASTPLRGEAAGRINILVMGVDNAARLSDTLMIISLDTHDGNNYKAAFVSIPRDMYVPIPEYGNAKINAAYSYGRANGGKDGGVKLTQKTVEEILGIPIHYFAAMNFKGFTQLIDTVGGVDVNVKTAIDDPYYPAPGYRGYQPFSISAGQHHLDGATALAYVRSRKTTTDYDRAARQQQIIVSVKTKLLSSQVYLHKGKIDDIVDILDKHLITNISTREALKFAKVLRDLPDGNVSRHVIDSSNYLVAIAGTSDLIPRLGQGNFSAIAEFVKNIFKEKGNNLPEAQQ